MKYAQVECKLSTTNSTDKSTSTLSEMFPTVLPSLKTIALPTPREIVTPTSKKHESLSFPYWFEASRTFHKNTVADNTVHNQSATLTVKLLSNGETIYTYNEDFENPNTNVRCDLQTGTYQATYEYSYTYDEPVGGTNDYRVTYIYSFAAVENKLPLKPWTILSVVERILDIAEPVYSEGVSSTVAHPRYIVDPDQRDWLEYADAEKKALRLAPEFTMTRCTLREQLKIVGAYIHAEPRLIHKTVDGVDRYCIRFDLYGETKQSPAANYPYVFRKRVQDINQYCTSINSITENMVNSSKMGRGTVVNPCRVGWISTRCASEHVRVTDGNGFAPTDFPVARIVRVLAGAWDRDKRTWAVGMTDITPYVVEATAYNANLSSYGGVYPYSKSYAIYYTMGQKNLQGLFFRDPTASQVSMTNWAIVNILASVSNKDADYLQKLMERRPSDFAFQIDYDPIYSSHIAHGKQDVDPDAVDYAQISNQSENMIEVSYYGENLKGIAARMGEVEEIRTGFVQKFSDLPKVGEMIGDMAISCVSSEMRPVGIKYTIALTKNFNRISQFIGINSHKRLYEVSERQVYQRHILLREYGVFKIGSKFEGTHGIFGKESLDDVMSAFAAFQGDLIEQADYVYARLLSKDKQEAYQLVQLPVVASPMGNVASYSWQYADNYSAGAQVDVRADGSGAYQQEVPYCDYYGRGWWYEFAVQQYRGENPDDKNIYYATDGPKTWSKWDNVKGGALISTENIGSLLLRKDSREAIGFTAQLEFKSDTPGLIIGSGIAQRLTSIAGSPITTCKIYFLNAPINKFEMRKLMSDATPQIPIFVEQDEDKTFLKIKGALRIPAAADGCQAWVIAAPPKKGKSITYQNDDGTTYTDTNMEGGEVLLAMNKPIVGGAYFPTIYFTLVKDIFQ